MLLAGAAPAPVRAGWSEPETVAELVDSEFLAQPSLVPGRGGGFALAWTETDGIRVATAHRTARFGRPASVPRSRGEYAPALGLDERGNLTIAWVYSFECEMYEETGDTCEGIRASARLSSGRFTPRRTLSSERFDTFYPRVAVGPRGRTVAWWGGFDNGAGARVARRPGRFGRVERRGRDIYTWTFDSKGGAELVEATRSALVAVRRAPSGGFSRVSTLARRRPGQLRAIHDIVADARGGAAVLWSRKGGKDSSPRRPTELHATLRGPGGRFRPSQLLAVDRRVPSVAPTRIASGGSGLVVAAWSVRSPESAFDYEDPPEAEVRAAIRLPGRRFARSQLLEPRRYERPVYGLSAAAGGRTAVVAWRTILADGAPGILAARSGPRGRFGRSEVVVRGADALSDPAVAVDAHGRAVIAWVDGLRVRSARWR